MTGAVNLTCDAWQANTTDGYFAVTGSWIEHDPDTPGADWKLQTALFGFVRMNCAHSGKHLGEALYKVVARLKIEDKVRSRTAILTSALLILFTTRDRLDT